MKRRGGQRWGNTQAPGAPGVRQEGMGDRVTGGGRDETGQGGEMVGYRETRS